MNRKRVFAVFFRYLYLLKKGLMQLSDLFYWPLIDIFLWGLTSAWIQTQSNIPNLPLILMTALIFYQISWRGSVDVSTNILQEIWNRNLINLFSTPLKLSEWVAGSLLLSLCKCCSPAGNPQLVAFSHSLGMTNDAVFPVPGDPHCDTANP